MHVIGHIEITPCIFTFRVCSDVAMYSGSVCVMLIYASYVLASSACLVLSRQSVLVPLSDVTVGGDSAVWDYQQAVRVYSVRVF